MVLKYFRQRLRKLECIIVNAVTLYSQGVTSFILYILDDILENRTARKSTFPITYVD